MIMAMFWLIALFVVLVDPLDIYPWGVKVTLRDVDYAKGAIPYILEAAIKNRANDAFLIGGSTSVGFTRAMLDASFPDVHHAFNLSYGAPRPFDQALVEKMVADRVTRSGGPAIKRVLLAIDWIHQLNTHGAQEVAAQSQFPYYLYDSDPTNDVRMIGSTTISLALRAVRSQPLWRPDWDANIDNRSDKRGFQKFQSQRSLAKLASAILRHRRDVDLPSLRSCDDFFTIRDQIVPFAKRLSDAHIPLDVYFPPYSLAFYYVWKDDPMRAQLLGNSVLEDKLLYRKCLVDEISNIPGVRVFAFDDEAKIVGDLANYREAAHVQSEWVYKGILHAIATNQNRLTPQSVDIENAQLRNLVKNYQIFDSRTE